MRLIPRLGIVIAAALALSSPATAQDYPNRQVKIIVPFGAGGPADVFARVISTCRKRSSNPSSSRTGPGPGQ
jgi:tripartite-type tricarboxylate transporter receptor subunit TctC